MATRLVTIPSRSNACKLKITSSNVLSCISSCIVVTVFHLVVLMKDFPVYEINSVWLDPCPFLFALGSSHTACHRNILPMVEVTHMIH